MGFNTVILVLNDHTHELAKAPHALAFAICHPPHSNRYEELERNWWPQVMAVARDHGEDASSFRNALRVMPTFHADDKHVLIAGWNSLIRPAYEDYKLNKNRTKITVNLPEWWSR